MYVRNDHAVHYQHSLISIISYVASSDIVGCIKAMCVDVSNKVKVKVKHLNTIIPVRKFVRLHLASIQCT